MIFYVQARPETIHSQRNPTTITEYKIEDENRHDKLLLKVFAGDKIGSGLATILYSMDVRVSDGHEFIPGSILVTDMTDPDWEPIKKKLRQLSRIKEVEHAMPQS
jgi:pyruvate,water dikinase